MQKHDNPPASFVSAFNGKRIFSQLTDCGHTGLLHIEIGPHTKPKIINTKPGESVTQKLAAFSRAEVAALFAVSPLTFSEAATQQGLVNHFFLQPGEIQAGLFATESEFVQWLSTQPLTGCFATYQEAAEQLACYETNPEYTAVMHHWKHFLELLPEQKIIALASA
jgi:hypothetical protein